MFVIIIIIINFIEKTGLKKVCMGVFIEKLGSRKWESQRIEGRNMGVCEYVLVCFVNALSSLPPSLAEISVFLIFTALSYSH